MCILKCAREFRIFSASKPHLCAKQRVCVCKLSACLPGCEEILLTFVVRHVSEIICCDSLSLSLTHFWLVRRIRHAWVRKTCRWIVSIFRNNRIFHSKLISTKRFEIFKYSGVTVHCGQKIMFDGSTVTSVCPVTVYKIAQCSCYEPHVSWIACEWVFRSVALFSWFGFLSTSFTNQFFFR